MSKELDLMSLFERNRFYSVTEISKLSGISYSTIRKRIIQRNIDTGPRYTRALQIEYSDIEKIMDKQLEKWRPVQITTVDPNRMYSPKECAEILNRTTSLIYKYIQEGKLGPIRRGEKSVRGKMLIRGKYLLKLLEYKVEKQEILDKSAAQRKKQRAETPEYRKYIDGKQS